MWQPIHTCGHMYMKFGGEIWKFSRPKPERRHTLKPMDEMFKNKDKHHLGILPVFRLAG